MPSTAGAGIKDFFIRLPAISSPALWQIAAGGTAVKDISANDLIEDLKAKGVNAFFVADRKDLLNTMRPHFTPSTTLLLMGARDPSLGDFAKQVWGEL
jgi:UDP-N-acetylmuramate--alanine ligase